MSEDEVIYNETTNMTRRDKMKTKAKRIWVTCFSVLLSILILVSCGAGGGADYANDEYSASGSPQVNRSKSDGGLGFTGDSSYDYYITEEAEIQDQSLTSEEFGAKIVYTTHMNIETLNYDKSLGQILESLKSLDGHVSYSEYYGGKKSDGSYNARSAYLDLRIPVKNYNVFLDGVSEFGNITYRADSSEDITMAYMDTEARIAALKDREKRLEELLAMAESLDDLLKIEQELAQVRYEIDIYVRQLQYFENMVQYSTVTIRLSEVLTYSAQNKGFFARVWDAIKGSLVFVTRFFEALLIILIYLLPFILIAAVGFFAFRPFWKKQAQKRAEKKQARRAAHMAAMPPQMVMMPQMPQHPPARPPVAPPPVAPPAKGDDKVK